MIFYALLWLLYTILGFHVVTTNKAQFLTNTCFAFGKASFMTEAYVI